jgi:hypothetical protein
VETSAGEPLISTWPFAGVERIPPVSQASSLVILKSATVSHPTLLSSFPYIPTHKKTQRLQKPYLSHITRRLNILGGMSAYTRICLPVRSSGVNNLWSVSRQGPLDTTPLTEIGLRYRKNLIFIMIKHCDIGISSTRNILRSQTLVLKLVAYTHRYVL